MKVGIDGNCWYCSNGLSLGDPRAEFSFDEVLGKAFDEYKSKFNARANLPKDLIPYVSMTADEYCKHIKGNG